MGRRSDHSRDELRALVLAAAEKIADAEGLHGLGARKVMREVGYTIGTFYQLYGRLDELIVELNGRVLDELYGACLAAPQDPDPETYLSSLAAHYIRFTQEHPKRWAILFEHRLPNDEELPDWYNEKILRLLGLIEIGLSPLFSPTQHDESLHAARVVWSSLHGICSLGAAQKLIATESVESLTDTLITTYLAGLRATQTKPD